MPEFYVPAHPGATSEEMSARVSSYPRRDTKPEKVLRSELHRRGLRYRVQHPVPGRSRRTIDVAFTKAKLAVFVDGCFWHGCSEHGVVPKSSTAWWEEKLEANRQRDRDTDEALAEAGWTVLRFWEHEDPSVAAEKVWWALRPGASGGPGDDYLHDVGQIAWQVSTLEWLVLGELPSMGLGAELLDLEGESTGTIVLVYESNERRAWMGVGNLFGRGWIWRQSAG